jgi:hypothetical protein
MRRRFVFLFFLELGAAEELAPAGADGLGIGAVFFVELFDEGDVGAEVGHG